jgi:hypothetical protein
MFFKMQFLSFGAVVVAGSSLVAERRLVAGQGVGLAVAPLVVAAGAVEASRSLRARSSLVALAVDLADLANKNGYDE